MHIQYIWVANILLFMFLPIRNLHVVFFFWWQSRFRYKNASFWSNECTNFDKYLSQTLSVVVVISAFFNFFFFLFYTYSCRSDEKNILTIIYVFLNQRLDIHLILSLIPFQLDFQLYLQSNIFCVYFNHPPPRKVRMQQTQKCLLIAKESEKKTLRRKDNNKIIIQR